MKFLFRFLSFVVLFVSLGMAAQLPLNVVVVLVDDLGWMDLGCQGSDFYNTPNIDRLAETGMRFTDGYASCAVCSPTRGSPHDGAFTSSSGHHGLDTCGVPAEQQAMAKYTSGIRLSQVG